MRNARHPNRGHSTYLDLALEFTFEATPNNLPLTRLQTIGNSRNRTDVISLREENKFMVDEVRDCNLSRIVVEVGTRLEWNISRHD